MGGEIVHALDNVSFEIEAGEFISIMGPSGSGKSTLMNLIGALDKPTSGDLIINGQNLSRLDADGYSSFRNTRIGFVFQQFNLLPRTTALENVKLPLLYSRDHRYNAEDRARECLTRVGLQDRLDHQPTQLSGGQQQRVAIARALVNAPDMILADEPTGALDTHTSEEILRLFQELNDTGITIIIVTHEPEVAEATRRRLLFRDGHLVDDRKYKDHHWVVA
ncbi:MAG: macrolide ABC transporter ATP-binding protein [Gammaproteobacteria bacterium]|nr:macrolide ABC transporter ATP-binding protein [Gammaproteobacteria bacterium]